MNSCYVTESESAIPIHLIQTQNFKSWLESQEEFLRSWVSHTGFDASPDRILLVPNSNGHINRVLLGVTEVDQFWHAGGLPIQLSQGIFELNPHDFETPDQLLRAQLAFGLGSYQFTSYLKKPPLGAKLRVQRSNIKALSEWLTTLFLVRDWINTPTEDMGPPELAETVIQVAKQFSAKTHVIRDADLLKARFNAIHTVGRAGSRPPCLIDLEWGNESDPQVTLIGKGVCFDTGGLDIKNCEGMALMKKDMGGAAHALGLARMIMSFDLPIRLRVLIPAVENAIGSKSYRPGDVITLHNGMTVEVNNTDAEGRLILADVLSEASSRNPHLMIDFATLTGAGRQALGPDIPALFSNQAQLGNDLFQSGVTARDPVWQLPLHQPYFNYLRSEIADLSNCSRVPMGGAITAALFLQRFVSPNIPWAHYDMGAWNFELLPGRPVGGEAFAIRGVYDYLEKQFRRK